MEQQYLDDGIKKIPKLWSTIHLKPLSPFSLSLSLPPSCMALWGLAVVRKWRHVEIMHRGLEPSLLNTSHHHHSLFTLLSLHILTPARVFKVRTKTHVHPEQKREWKWDEFGLFCRLSGSNKTIGMRAWNHCRDQSLGVEDHMFRSEEKLGE